MNTFCDHPVESLGNGHVRLEYLADVGPRIARLFSVRLSINLLAELPEAGRDTPYGRFRFMGGHRLWHSPEALPRTYIPDQAVTLQPLVDGVRLSAAVEPGSGIAKAMEIHLAPSNAVVTLRHEIRNNGLWAVELAPWALTMLRLGGTVILPQPVGNLDSDGLLPNRQLTIWPYTNVQDARLQLADDFILVKAQAALPPCKIGYFNPQGWIACWLDGMLFVKRYTPQRAAAFPDGGCNTEMYCNDRFVELETLGPLTQLAPGETSVHEESWELYDGLEQPFLPEDVRQRLMRLSHN